MSSEIGIYNGKIKDAERIAVTCCQCNNSFTVSYGTFRKRQKDYNYICPSCYKIYRKESWFNELPEEKRNRLSGIFSETSKKYFSNADNRIIHSEKVKSSLQKRSESEKQIQRKRISECRKKYWASLSREEVLDKMSPLFEGSKKFWDSVSEEDKYVIYQKLSEIKKKWYHDLTKEELDCIYRKVSIGRKRYWESLSEIERFDYMKKLWSSQVIVGPTEKIFANILSMNHISFDSDHMNDLIHPEYYKIFGENNKITNSVNCPYHRWDFIVYLKDKFVLIDVDGSVHDKNNMHFKRGNNNYTEREKIDFNDSQRLYQTDGLDAYIIQCYNDKMTDANLVININTNEILTLKMLVDNLISDSSKNDIKIVECSTTIENATIMKKNLICGK